MREGDFYPIQHDPTVMGMSIKDLFDGCNWILLIFDGAIGSSLHRHCTKFLDTLKCSEPLRSQIFYGVSVTEIYSQKSGLLR